MHCVQRRFLIQHSDNSAPAAGGSFALFAQLRRQGLLMPHKVLATCYQQPASMLSACHHAL
jgi:hypothetical protein